VHLDALDGRRVVTERATVAIPTPTISGRGGLGTVVVAAVRFAFVPRPHPTVRFLINIMQCSGGRHSVLV